MNGYAKTKSPHLPPEAQFDVLRFLMKVEELSKGRSHRSGLGVALLLLFLRQNGVLQNLEEQETSKFTIDAIEARMARTPLNPDVHKVFLILIRQLGRPDVARFQEMVRACNELKPELCEELYPTVVEYVFSSFVDHGNSWGAGLPYELAKVILELAQLPPHGNVYNPFAGTTSICGVLPRGTQYHGQELNEDAWALGAIRMHAHDDAYVSNLFHGDPVHDWNPAGRYYDLIISNPPFNLRVDGGMPFAGKYAPVESFLLFRALQDLRPQGKAILVVPTAFLFTEKGVNASAREKLVREGLLDTVISFPGGLFPNTNVQCALVVVDNGRERSAPVRMVDASSLVRKDRDKRVIDDMALVAMLNGGEHRGVIRYTSIAKLSENSFNLNPARYLGEPISGIPLGDVVRVAKLERRSEQEALPHVRVRDLSSSISLDALDISTVQSVEPDRSPRVLQDPAVLVALQWGELRPTWFDGRGVSVQLGTSVHALTIDQNVVDPIYLLQELRSPKVQEQVARLSEGTSVPKLRMKDLLSVRIELPPIQEQRATVKGLREAHVAAQMEQARSVAERLGVEVQQASNTASLRHLLGTPLLNLNSGVENIRFTLEKVLPGWQQHLISTREQLTLGDALDNLSFELQRVATLLETDSTELNVKRFPLTEMDLLAYVRGTRKRVQQDLNGGHQVDLLLSEEIKSGRMIKPMILGSTALLDLAVDAIVDNARRHAFPSAQEPHVLEFRLDVDLTNTKPSIVFRISNNGKAFPEGFGRDRYVTKSMFAGSAGHTGLGGYHVNQVVQWHKGHLDLLTDISAAPWATTIEMRFPLFQ